MCFEELKKPDKDIDRNFRMKTQANFKYYEKNFNIPADLQKEIEKCSLRNFTN